MPSAALAVLSTSYKTPEAWRALLLLFTNPLLLPASPPVQRSCECCPGCPVCAPLATPATLSLLVLLRCCFPPASHPRDDSYRLIPRWPTTPRPTPTARTSLTLPTLRLFLSTPYRPSCIHPVPARTIEPDTLPAARFVLGPFSKTFFPLAFPLPLMVAVHHGHP